MSTQPSRSTASGRVYLDLQRRAREERKPTKELLVRYVHERSRSSTSVGQPRTSTCSREALTIRPQR